MPIDSSIYGNIKGPQQLDIGALINQARAAQQYQGESAIGDIYKEATTGDPNQPIDAGKLGLLASRAGPFAGRVAQESQNLAQGQQAIDRNKLVHRFQSSNHIRRPFRVYRTKCGRQDVC
jgi:hypothetical protein